MAAGGTPGDVKLGPGRLYVAALGATEPTGADSALPSGSWRPVGYTEAGNIFTSQATSEDVEVAEEIEPIRKVRTKDARSVQFQMAEATRANLALALNVGANEVNDDTEFEPPDAADEERVMIVWDSEESPTNPDNVRWLFRQCYQDDAFSLSHQKAPAKALLPARFAVEKPASGAKSFKVFPNSDGHVA